MALTENILANLSNAITRMNIFKTILPVIFCYNEKKYNILKDKSINKILV